MNLPVRSRAMLPCTAVWQRAVTCSVTAERRIAEGAHARTARASSNGIGSRVQTAAPPEQTANPSSSL